MKLERHWIEGFSRGGMNPSGLTGSANLTSRLVLLGKTTSFIPIKNAADKNITKI